MTLAALPRRGCLAVLVAFAGTLGRPEVRRRMDNLDLHSEGLAGAAASGRLAELSGHYGQMIRTTGMKVE